MNQEIISSSPSTCGGTCDGGRTASAVKPAYQVERHDEGVSLHLALPGVPKDQVGISLQDGTLTVTATRSRAVPDDWKTHQEFRHPDHYRLAVQLNPDLDPSTIKATLTDGVLTLTIERHEAAKPRAIEVN